MITRKDLINKKRNESVMTIETFNLMQLICLIPEMFKSVLIFESDEIEDFDIGLEEFWLSVKQDIEWQSFPNRSDYFKGKYAVFTKESEFVATEGVRLFHYKKTLIQKPKYKDGIIDEEGVYNKRIRKMLSFIEQTQLA